MTNSDAPVAAEVAPTDMGDTPGGPAPADPTESETAAADIGDTPGSPAPADPTESETAATDELARNQEIGAWVEAGATSIPAMLIALGSAAVGGVALAIRRRRRR